MWTPTVCLVVEEVLRSTALWSRPYYPTSVPSLTNNWKGANPCRQVLKSYLYWCDLETFIAPNNCLFLGTRCSTIKYDCNTQVSTYLWPYRIWTFCFCKVVAVSFLLPITLGYQHFPSSQSLPHLINAYPLRPLLFLHLLLPSTAIINSGSIEEACCGTEIRQLAAAHLLTWGDYLDTVLTAVFLGKRRGVSQWPR